ncbi:hypothetical protein [Aquibium oceanicum]|uniref:Uncharacterized protein n=1 Tax=Aquibium oceanicum TaxID=1670800 RepID=A0A1L3SLR0_9HYPH|nr:hypothetical protein [Aquibium oceanicum]APH70349.1 hypothetical protein BSQ44_02340 [Aquibium oceanicum]
MTNEKNQVSKEAERGQRKPTAPATGSLPDVGALDEDDIKSVDLEPRSNGETDWQGDVTSDRAGKPDRKRG